MVLINSSYNTDTAYRETLSNLCPNTYYEFSGGSWNVLPKMWVAIVLEGEAPFLLPARPGNDSSGVKPNINFEIDGLAYYSSGDMKYDRITPWKNLVLLFLPNPGKQLPTSWSGNNSPVVVAMTGRWRYQSIALRPSLKMNYNPFVLGCTTALSL